MIQNKSLPDKRGTPPEEENLRLMLRNGMKDVVETLIDNWQLKYKVEEVNGEFILKDSVVGAELWLKRFITEDEDMLVMKQDAHKLSSVDDEVLITGETGTGKEIIARAMIGDRAGKFVAVNCAGLPEHLIESELFGHKAGAFTGAASTKQGLLMTASKPEKGVLFLDEIGELPITVQAKLLRALQEKLIRPVGSNDEIEINCRFVCATHRNLREMVNNNTFRQDLYARISTFHLHIKPLRERMNDITPIIKAIGSVLKIDAKAKEFLERYKDDFVNDKIDLSLNVRSLERALKRYNLLGKVNSHI